MSISVAFLLSVEAALGGTASVTASAVVYDAAPGETNTVAISAKNLNDPVVYEVTDTSAVVTAGAGCVAVSDHAASCTGPRGTFDDVLLRLGDMDDKATAAALCPPCEPWAAPFMFVGLYGGAGDDDVTGGRAGFGGTSLYGGAGDDTLTGGPTDDRLVGGSGADTLEGGPDAPDSEGVRPFDHVSYAGHHHGVRVDFDGVADDGAAGEGDNVLPSIEGASGGTGNDVLVGNGRSNAFSGGRGDDILFGRGGYDEILGGPGVDRIYGGPSNDTLSGDRGDDWIVGGPGNDMITGGDRSGSADGWEGTIPDRYGDDRIYGGNGRDFILDQGGSDRVSGGPRADFLFGGRGRDVLRGGDGPDEIVSSSDGRSDRVYGGLGIDEARVDRLLDSVRGIERLDAR